jgi:curved DNA-binding protein CbpA
MPEEVQDLYLVLGVQRWADQSVIEEQYRSKLEQWSGWSMDDLESAYAVLSDPTLRGEYDELLIEQDVAAYLEAPASGVMEKEEGYGRVGNAIFFATLLLILIGGIVARWDYITGQTDSGDYHPRRMPPIP